MSAESPVVQLKQGQLRGRAVKNTENPKYYEFKGIPYAKPPIDELRFKAPQPPDPWDGERDGTKDCPSCAQLDRFTTKVTGDEDCLYLNVFTPKLPPSGGDPIPVMFYIHGGGFIFGSGTDVNAKGPDYLVAQDVIVVSINYRLSVFGFLCLDLLEAQGNMGLKDQVRALKWVQENICQFGGDPANVTIFGGSAGGASVEYLQLSPMAKGLFHKAIVQSGSVLNAWARNSCASIKKLAFRMAELRGKSMSNEEDLLKYLMSISAEELVQAYTIAMASEEHRGGMHFGFVPTVEKPFEESEAFLTEETYGLLKRGEFNKVPLLSGFCRREGLLVVNQLPQIVETILKGKSLAQFLPFKLDDQQRSELEKRLKFLYLDGADSSDEIDDYVINFFTDVDCLGGLWAASKLKAHAHSPSYLYEFAYDGKLNYLKRKLGIDRPGACHGDEMGYLTKNAKLPDDVPETDKLVRSRMVRMWTNFAKFGEPTPETNELLPTKWKPLTVDCDYLVIDDQLTMKQSLYPKRMQFFEHLYENHWM